MRPMLAIGLIVAAGLLGILNSGGYRYGISDQAFYVPAIMQHLDSSLFPRDRALFHAQDRFMLFDDLAAAVVEATGIPVPTLFVGLFVMGLLGYFGACVELGRHLYRSPWSVAALIFVLTLRHRITLTGANTLEGYLHPRMLAFAVAVWGLVAFLRGRSLVALTLVAGAAALHTTTALWFAVWLGVAIFAADPRSRRPVAVAVLIAAAGSMWAVWLGPLREGLEQMDARWVSVLDLKDYLFPTEWPWSAWLVNLSYAAVMWTGYRMRAARSLALPREGALVLGALALVALFLLSLPFVMMRLALAVQLQVSRVFWMLELMAAIYLVWMALESTRRRSGERPVRSWVTIAFAAAAAARGTYIMQVEQPGRPLVQVTVPQDDWTDVMQWLRSTPPGAHVLADPGHAFRYGTSERILGERDVLLESSKDTALALYSRAVAYRVLERIEATGEFDALRPDAIVALAAQYDLGYLVTEQAMPFTRVYANRRFNVYSLARRR